MKYLLDTNVMSEAGKKSPSPKVLNWLLQHEAAALVPAIALAERYQGAEAAPEREQRLISMSVQVEPIIGTGLQPGVACQKRDLAASADWPHRNKPLKRLSPADAPSPG